MKAITKRKEVALIITQTIVDAFFAPSKVFRIIEVQQARAWLPECGRRIMGMGNWKVPIVKELDTDDFVASAHAAKEHLREVLGTDKLHLSDGETDSVCRAKSVIESIVPGSAVARQVLKRSIWRNGADGVRGTK